MHLIYMIIAPIQYNTTFDEQKLILISFPFSVQDLFIYKKGPSILQIMEVHQSETGQKINNHNKDGPSQATFPDSLRVCHQRGHPKRLI